MRRIGSLHDSNLADRFSEYLLTQSIECNVDVSKSSDGSGEVCDLWIRDESHVAQAKEEFEAFRKTPDAEKYQVASDAERIRKEKAAEEKRRKSFQQKVQHRSSAGGVLAGVPIKQQSIPVVIGVIVISVVVGFATGMGNPMPSQIPGELSTEERVYNALSFVTRRAMFETNDPYSLIKEGQVWRLITPTFLHGNTIHLAFNMLAIFFLGSILERMHGSVFVAILIFASALAGTLVQIHLPPAERLPEILWGLAGTPYSIGASGGVYGLFGYVWIRPAVSANYPLQLPQSSVVMLLLWIPIGIFFIGGIANGAHIGGLIVGMIAAVIHAQLSDGGSS